MNRGIIRARKYFRAEETDGFKFAITLLATLSTGLYALYNYFQNTAIDNSSYANVSGFIPVALILLFLLIYVFIKGYSMEIQETNHKKYLNKLASGIYLITFLMFLMLLTLISGIFILVFYNIKPTQEIFAVIFIISISVIIILDWPRIRSQWKQKIVWNIALAIFLLAYGLIFWLIFFTTVLNSPFQGHVTADMNSFYYKNGVPISVLIQVTGPNTGLVVRLDKEDSEHNLSNKDKIEMKPEHNPDKTMNGTYLTGNALDYGKYMVFINTTNMTEGYYELTSVRPKYEKSSAIKSFYLLNISNDFTAYKAQ